MNHSSQLIITEKAEVLRNSLASFNTQNNVFEYRNIMQHAHEAAQTIFYDGIISPPVFSMKLRGYSTSKMSCEYITLYELNTQKSLPTIPFIFDFETENIQEINKILADNFVLFQSVSVLDFIISCCVLPVQVAEVSEEFNHRFLWKDADLVHKKITANLQVAVI